MARQRKRVKKSGQTSNEAQPDVKTPKALKPEPKITKQTNDQNVGKSKASKASPEVQGKPEKANIENQKKGNATTQAKHQKEENNTVKKLGGMIFMCNHLTKADCFRYKIMGLPESKRDLVMKINPGLTLFLYDFGGKLLHGVYKASSAGGMNLEPSAFGGSYPAQVRFEVHEDHSPVPDNLFKKAIKSKNDGKKNWFKTELTVEQAEKLVELFRSPHRPASKAATVVSDPRSTLIAGPVKPVQASLLPLPETIARSARDDSRPYYARPVHQETVPRQSDTVPRDHLSLSEKDYRTYGLRPPAPVSVPAPAVTALDASRATKEAIYPYRSEEARYPPYLSEEARNPYRSEEARYAAYRSEEARYAAYRSEEARYPYRSEEATHLYRSVSDRYAPAPRGAPYPREGDSLADPTTLAAYNPSYSYGIVAKRGDAEYGGQANEVGMSHSSHAASALSDYSQRYQVAGSRDDVGSSLPVSSRYSFAGPPAY